MVGAWAVSPEGLQTQQATHTSNLNRRNWTTGQNTAQRGRDRRQTSRPSHRAKQRSQRRRNGNEGKTDPTTRTTTSATTHKTTSKKKGRRAEAHPPATLNPNQKETSKENRATTRRNQRAKPNQHTRKPEPQRARRTDHPTEPTTAEPHDTQPKPTQSGTDHPKQKQTATPNGETQPTRQAQHPHPTPDTKRKNWKTEKQNPCETSKKEAQPEGKRNTPKRQRHTKHRLQPAGKKKGLTPESNKKILARPDTSGSAPKSAPLGLEEKTPGANVCFFFVLQKNSAPERLFFSLRSWGTGVQ